MRAWQMVAKSIKGALFIVLSGLVPLFNVAASIGALSTACGIFCLAIGKFTPSLAMCFFGIAATGLSLLFDLAIVCASPSGVRPYRES